MSDENWALRAIEREAMARAHRQMLAMTPPPRSIFGMSLSQVAWLRAAWMRTGQRPESIPTQGVPPEELFAEGYELEADWVRSLLSFAVAEAYRSLGQDAADREIDKAIDRACGLSGPQP